ncbi:MAG: NifU family protein [Candidatus Kapaibacterium sp.]|nr:MAG: NifU family protein [Candidatus Kapabacteria bacterium]
MTQSRMHPEQLSGQEPAIEGAIRAALDECRPYLQRDGGDVELVRFEVETATVEVRFVGACVQCPLVQMTLRAGIERLVQLRVPAVRRIELVK